MFIYALANIGFEKFLKDEVATKSPVLKLSYSRPGFLTFKSAKDISSPSFIFARATGISLCRCTDADLERTIAIHAGSRIVQRYSIPTGTCVGEAAPVDAEILDVVEVVANEFWIGVRTAPFYGWSLPGALPQIPLPEAAPSRAYLKLEEMLAWSRFSPTPKTIAVELGSAPGGASWALLNRGLRVVGVDTGEMGAVCLENPNYSHVAMSVRDLRKKNLPEHFPLLFCDLGLTAVEAVPQLRHLCHIYPDISRIYYTMKMGKGLSIADIDAYSESLRTLGFKIHVTHLPANRNEIFMLGVRKTGL